ncbi:hypothetical protein L7F22_009537 [Adiantum nelumboides]|nr:hypothetical protein [Adiantum nelumboides]
MKQRPRLRLHRWQEDNGSSDVGNFATAEVEILDRRAHVHPEERSRSIKASYDEGNPGQRDPYGHICRDRDGHQRMGDQEGERLACSVIAYVMHARTKKGSSKLTGHDMASMHAVICVYMKHASIGKQMESSSDL